MKVESKDRDGNDLVCYVRKPTSKDNHDAKLYSNGVASSILLRKDENNKPNFITRGQVRQILKDSGRLSENDEKEILDLSKKIKEQEDKLIAGGIKKTLGREIAINLRNDRNRLFLALLNINELDEHTLESEVENANFDFLVSACSSREDGTKLFESVTDYLVKADDEPYAYDVAQALKVLLYGTTEDMIKNNIENKFLLKYKYIDEKMRLINKEGKLIDEDNNLIDESGNIVDENGQIVVKRKLELGQFEDDEPVVSVSIEPVEDEVKDAVVAQ